MDKTITLSDSVIASFISCVIIMAVLCSFLIILYTSSLTFNLDCESSAENASSNSKISGLIASVLIKATV
ncbi:MAG: hypothetical protein IKO49_03500 [Bacilli bacterium]|nr:hypothetical protein [Bacilli bacterium]